MSKQPKEIIVRNFKIDPKDIVLMKAILESYEGMVVVRTVETEKNIIELLIANGFSEVMDKVICELQNTLVMQEVPLTNPWVAS